MPRQLPILRRHPLIIRRIDGSSDPLFQSVLDLYHQEFPPETREPDERLVEEADGLYRLAFRFDVAEDAGVLAGFVRWAYLQGTNAIFIIHIAVDEAYRGRGIGRMLVERVRQEKYEAIPTLMEIEPKLWPWWRKFEARILTKTYTQPSLGEGLPEVPLWLAAIDPCRSATHDTVVRFYQEVWEMGEREAMVQKAIRGCTE